jgi:dipeptidyl aminopeptidase/acylaminoacyl peptidase
MSTLRPTAISLCFAALLLSPPLHSEPRPVTFLDIVNLRSPASVDISPDAKAALFELSVADWKAGKRFTDIYWVSLEGAPAPPRQLTFTPAHNESSPRWAPSSQWFAFLSNRSGAANQLYRMRPDGGEAERLTDHKGGVHDFAFSHDGRWLVYSAGSSDERQLWLLSLTASSPTPEPLTKHPAPIASWLLTRDSRHVFFTAPAQAASAEQERLKKGFTAKLRNPPAPPHHLWSVALAGKQVKQWTTGSDTTVSDIVASPDSRWLAFRRAPNNRYQLTVTERNLYADLFLLDTTTGHLDRLTDNQEIGESKVSFSPDSRLLAFSAPEDFTFFRRQRIYVRPVASGPLKKLGNSFDGDLTVAFWSTDSSRIYSNEGIGATQQLLSVSVASGNVEQLTHFRGVLSVTFDEDSGRFLAAYQDPHTPLDYYALSSLSALSDRARWRRLTDSNPALRDSWLLGAVDTIQWKSTDGATVEGILVLPTGYQPGQRYPLIVQIHGGPAAASLLNFNATYSNYSQIYAGAGYACLLPNYRGSTNYGEKFRTQIAGNYFQQGYDDIIAGVDHLIARGIADPDRLGVMGWSAGGHWSNWILTHTHRFKAISSGAGAMNWISMYAQNDIQRLREHYFGGLPYDHFDHYWDVSPLKHIKNARPPTLIHVVDGDPRVPRPQSEELYMALRKLGVPTEFLVYPGSTHGITDMRNQVLKMMAEFRWMEKWVRQQGEWLRWEELLALLPDSPKPAAASDLPSEIR